MTVELKILDLNFWGVWLISKHIQQRLAALIQVLEEPTAPWDLVVLQEVWSDRDYNQLASRIQHNYPHTYYFHSGVIGSGVCVFSRGPIVSVLCHRYSLNGYAHKVWHGDWFGGKVAGLCKIVHKGLRINLYATHVHAEYDREADTYLAHRIVQAYELSQFIRCTNAADDDINIVAGDFNFEPTDLGYQIVTQFAELKDSCTFALPAGDAAEVNTCNTPDNVYSICEGKHDKVPRGKRIDFVMFGQVGGRTKVQCSESRTVLNRIPDSPLCYSDHKGLQVTLQVATEADTEFLAEPMTPEPKTVGETYAAAVGILEGALQKVRWDRRFFYALMSAAFVGLLSTVDSDSQASAAPRWAMLAVRVLLVVLMVGALWMAAILSRIEYHSLLATRNAMRIQQEHLYSANPLLRVVSDKK
ncbi:putative neutral sphingomyelinase [Paramacrobiotus metropolitanus]|uniref:putative neutral sphingomyelinase n=1 Tax=Paramacrobiotus metropolitanus TaxID=2943436 RepID=UPI00244654CE|nr:putative neutral sphingomyelinase [Paramacrobiotus metropolitanus]XP_055343475.1 putative neutral sphingomyelinase [Paramacrobiotus metropolitanus]XP_055343476.1 putative neutral sphingomyelinase [Paramacrobiotus metropolitanus]